MEEVCRPCPEIDGALSQINRMQNKKVQKNIEETKIVLFKSKKIRFVSFKNNLAFELKKTKYLILEKIKEFVELNREKNTPDLSAGRISVLTIIDDRGLLSSGDVDNRE